MRVYNTYLYLHTYIVSYTYMYTPSPMYTAGETDSEPPLLTPAQSPPSCRTGAWALGLLGRAYLQG